MKKNHIILSAIFLLCIAITTIFTGCVGNNSLSSNAGASLAPETGIVHWMEAMNERDAGRLYQLSPMGVKQQINREDFIAVNAQNVMFLQNITFVDYKILNKTQKENLALIETQMIIARPNPGTGNITHIQIYYTFNESYENNEWKVWATGLEP